MDLTVRFYKENELTPGLKEDVNALDTLAFAEDQNDPILSKIEWASHDWMALGFIKNQLVTQLCLVKRKIKIGDTAMEVAGVGGVATQPQRQNQGFSSLLLTASREFMKNEMRIPFGLLLCEEKLIKFYASNGWQKVADSLWYMQDGQLRNLKSMVMVLPINDQIWPCGEIDLCGLPW